VALGHVVGAGLGILAAPALVIVASFATEGAALALEPAAIVVAGGVGGLAGSLLAVYGSPKL